jgi:hypothetical protein
VLLPLLASCTSSTGPLPSGAETWVVPNVGSTFTYDVYATDSLGVPIPGLRDTSISTVVQSNFPIGGKTGVVVFQNKSTGTLDSNFITYEANHNLTAYLLSDNTGQSVWNTIPVGTGGASGAVSEKSTVHGGVSTVTLDSTLITMVGVETLTIKGQSISTKKVTLQSHAVSRDDGVITISINATDLNYYYAPSLGFFVKETRPYRFDALGNHENGATQILIDYNLK